MGVKHQSTGTDAHKQTTAGEHYAVTMDRIGPTTTSGPRQLVYCCRPKCAATFRTNRRRQKSEARLVYTVANKLNHMPKRWLARHQRPAL